MQNIILHESLTGDWLLFLGIAIMFSLITIGSLLVTISIVRNFLNRYAPLGALIGSLLTTLFLGTIVSGSIYFATRQYKTEYNITHTPINHYYDFTKEGQLITATRKSSAPYNLKAKLNAKIISEDNKSYQVEYQNQYDSIPKSYLK